MEHHLWCAPLRHALLRIGSNDYNSFWVAIFWIAAGKCIADNELRLSKVNTSSLLAIMLVGLGAIYIEQFFILANQWSYADDCYLGLAVFCIPAFVLSLRVNSAANMRHSYEMRALSRTAFMTI